MNKIKRITSLLLCIVIIISLSSVSCFASNDSIKVYFDGKQLTFDVDPYITNSRTMVPMRAIFEEYGMTVTWDNSTQAITASNNSKTVKMQIGNHIIYNNQKSVYSDVAPLIKGSRTFIPIRIVSECLGMNVTWDENTRSIYITSESNTNVDPYILRIVNLVNEYRAENGLKSLTMSSQLNEVAQFKAQDMADNNYFDHTSPTYGKLPNLLSKFNVSWTACGENLAYGQTSPEEVMNDWMNSSGHRANILSSDFCHIGVGYVKDSYGYLYWVQEFTD